MHGAPIIINGATSRRPGATSIVNVATAATHLPLPTGPLSVEFRLKLLTHPHEEYNHKYFVEDKTLVGRAMRGVSYKVRRENGLAAPSHVP